jgi:hypothetical protein
MPRKKIGLEQRLNFWVSQDTYDFYADVAEKRGEKVSELLRHVLDRAQKLFDEEGNFTSDLPMSTAELESMMRKVAQEETSKLLRAGTDVVYQRGTASAVC